MLISANDSQINYEVSGPDNAPVVALSHSLACNLYMWDPQMQALEQHFRVLRYDTRGHGNSPATPEPYSLDLLGDDALALLDALNIEQVHWVGLSMGGMIGQNLALRAPERLLSLSLCDTMGKVPDEAQSVWRDRIATVRSNGMEGVVEATLQRWFTTEYLSQDPAPVKLIRQYILSTPMTGFIGCCEAIRGLNYLDQLNTVNLSTLVIVGEQDAGTPVAASEAMHAQLPNSELVVLPNASHLSNIEQADAFSTALIKFLQSV